MIKVLGNWELGWNTPILEFDLWSFPMREMGVDELIMFPISGIAKNVTEYATIEEALEANKDLIPVFVDERGTEELSTFEHPENVLYICGKASYSPWMTYKDKYKSLKIKTPKNTGMLWPHQAMSIILYDRMIKWQ